MTATTKPGGGGSGVTVAITKTKDWGSGYTDSATITNNSGSPVNGWNVQFDLDPNMNIESVTNATLTSSGNHQTLTNTSSDATIANGATVSVVFSGDYTTAYIAPTNVTVNGQGTGGSSPATPAGLTASGTTSSSISLSWTEPSGSDPAASYKVYEGSTVVGTSTTTSATIGGLAANSTHTYTVTAVDSAGNESSPSTAVTATTGPGGGNGGSFTQADIDSAVAAPLIAFAAPTSSVPRPGTNPVNIGAAKVLYYLALVDKENPTAKATNGTTVDSALLAQVRNLIAGGNEPDADGGLEGWSHAPVAEGLLLLKNGPAWAELSSAEQNKVTLLEAAMGYAGNYTYTDASNFSSGICGFGNFSKTNNPNYEDGYVDVEAAAIQFFGPSTWNGMLTGFDDATVASQLNSAGLTNAGGCFAKVGSGANSAIKKAFVFKGHNTGDLMGIWSQLAADTFDKTVTSSNGPAHIADNTTSPEQGKLGMGHEFASTDSSGLRSSALYTFEGWMNVTGNRVAMSALGNFTCTAATSAAQYNVGSLDLIYKLHHGYISYALNQNGILVDDHGDPATDGPNVKGYQYDHDAYTAIVTPQGC